MGPQNQENFFCLQSFLYLCSRTTDNRCMTQKERVIEHAAKMFAEQGIKSIRMDDIAKSMGISKRTLYEMFEDKEELLYLSIRFMQQRRMNMIMEKISTNRDSLAYLFDSLEMMTDNKELHRRISNNLRKFYPMTFERVRVESEQESGKILLSLLKHYVDKGLIKANVDLRLSVTILYYTATTLVTSADNMLLPKGVSLDAALSYTIVNFFRGIATIEGVHQIDEYFERKKQKN